MIRKWVIATALLGAVTTVGASAQTGKPSQPAAPPPVVKPLPPAIKPAPPVRPLAAISALAFSPDGKSLALGTYGQAIVLDATTWQPSTTIRKIEDTVRSIAWSPDGKRLAITSGLAARDGIVQLWDATGAGDPVTLIHQKDTIEAIAFNADGKQMLIGANDNKARWYTELPSQFGPLLDEHNGRVTACAFSSKPNFVFATGGMDKIVKVWDEKLKSSVINFDQCEAGVLGLAFLPNGVQVVGASIDGKLHWWQINYNERNRTYSGSYYRQIGAHDGSLYAFTMSADGKRLATGGGDDHVRVWNAESGGGERDFKDSDQPAYALAFTPDGKVLATGGRDGLIRIYDVEANKLLTTITPPPLPTPSASKKTTARGRFQSSSRAQR